MLAEYKLEQDHSSKETCPHGCIYSRQHVSMSQKRPAPRGYPISLSHAIRNNSDPKLQAQSSLQGTINPTILS